MTDKGNDSALDEASNANDRACSHAERLAERHDTLTREQLADYKSTTGAMAECIFQETTDRVEIHELFTVVRKATSVWKSHWKREYDVRPSPSNAAMLLGILMSEATELEIEDAVIAILEKEGLV